MSDYRPSMGGMRKAYHRWAIVNENVVAPSELDAEFDRFIDKIRAGALREAGAAVMGERLETETEAGNWLDERADRIEANDG